LGRTTGDPTEQAHQKETNMDQAVRHNRRLKSLKASLALMVISAMIASASASAATPEDEVRAAFDRFIAAQNAHDIKAVESLLLGSPDFLWVTRGTAVWGQEAAIKRFASLYQGTWRLEPDASNLKVVLLGSGVAQIHVPIMFTIGPAGQSPQQTRFLMNQLLVNTPNGWRVSSILPIPAPAQ
jgi:ketosteroid isomerase-like protein